MPDSLKTSRIRGRFPYRDYNENGRICNMVGVNLFLRAFVYGYEAIETFAFPAFIFPKDDPHDLSNPPGED
jgi:hypothetical protein